MKKTFVFVAAWLLLASIEAPISAQEPAPPPVSPAPLRSSAELEQLLGPIALYPDPLIAQLLPAALQPSDIVLADRYLQGGGDPGQIDAQSWSASVKAMAHYPDVLKWMDDNLAWTAAAGQAFLDQSADVMNAIQRLRAQAQTLGNLQSTPQQTVNVDNGAIEIVPANPEVIYVPVYQPEIVYERRADFGVGPFITFGLGFSIGAWLNHDWDWRNHHVVVWDRGHYRPRDWWYRPGPERFRPGGPRNDFHVWAPHVRTGTSSVNREDRGWEVRQNRIEPVRPITPRPRPNQPMRQVEPVRRPEPRRDLPPARVEPIQPRRPTEALRPSAPAPRIAPRPFVPAPPNGALLGIHSASETREFSNRGQQSRQVQTAPSSPRPGPSAPAPRQPAGSRHK